MAPVAASKDHTKTKNKKGTEKAIKNKPPKVNPNEFLRIKCPICFENINKESVSSTKCGHVFCTQCLQKALKRMCMCPTCRTRLRGPRGHHPLYLDTSNVQDDFEMDFPSELTVEAKK